MESIDNKLDIANHDNITTLKYLHIPTIYHENECGVIYEVLFVIFHGNDRLSMSNEVHTKH
ncbi:hypothetical protein ACUOFC_43325, partial [Escherichia sp. TWPC-MK]